MSFANMIAVCMSVFVFSACFLKANMFPISVNEGSLFTDQAVGRHLQCMPHHFIKTTVLVFIGRLLSKRGLTLPVHLVHCIMRLLCVINANLRCTTYLSVADCISVTL